MEEKLKENEGKWESKEVKETKWNKEIMIIGKRNNGAENEKNNKKRTNKAWSRGKEQRNKRIKGRKRKRRKTRTTDSKENSKFLSPVAWGDGTREAPAAGGEEGGLGPDGGPPAVLASVPHDGVLEGLRQGLPPAVGGGRAPLRQALHEADDLVRGRRRLIRTVARNIHEVDDLLGGRGGLRALRRVRDEGVAAVAAAPRGRPASYPSS